MLAIRWPILESDNSGTYIQIHNIAALANPDLHPNCHPPFPAYLLTWRNGPFLRLVWPLNATLPDASVARIVIVARHQSMAYAGRTKAIPKSPSKSQEFTFAKPIRRALIFAVKRRLKLLHCIGTTCIQFLYIATKSTTTTTTASFTLADRATPDSCTADKKC